MLSPKPPDDEDTPSPSPTAPSKQKRPVNATITPRRVSAKRVQNDTPIRNVSATKAPTSAPARKKPEATLLGDFLLGRPSPQRARRKSLDLVKMEMRAEVVGKVKDSKVKDRVKDWQKASAAAGEPGDVEPVEEGYEVGRQRDEEDMGEEERLRIKNSQRRPGRRKSREEGDDENADPKVYSKGLAAPKKRVVSDDHWMKNKEKKKSPPRQGAVIPKNFLQKTAANPPLERKIEDWVKRTASEEPEEPQQVSRRRKASRQVRVNDEIQIQHSRTPSADAGSQERAHEREATDHGGRIQSGKENPCEAETRKHGMPDDGICITASDVECEEVQTPTKRERRPRSKRQSKDADSDAIQTPKKRSQPLKQATDPERNRRVSTRQDSDGKEEPSGRSPSRTEKTKRKDSGSRTPPPESLDEIPFGNSAFSVLDIPVGANTGNTRKPQPKRNPSFSAVPKVFKKVYNVGRDIVHDTVDPPRVGLNQPPSIESWLNGTTDPFIDRPLPPTESSLGVPEPATSRRRSYKEDDEAEQELTADRGQPRSKLRQEVRSTEEVVPEGNSPLPIRSRETLPSMERLPGTSPAGLKRSPATRNTSSPKSTKKPLMDAIFGAFKGESVTYNPLAAEIIAEAGESIAHEPPVIRPLDGRQIFSEGPPLRNIRTSGDNNLPKLDHAHGRPLPPAPRRSAPITGAYRLSTIASVETLTTLSSASESAGTASVLSNSTITQDTVYTGPTNSNVSRKSSHGLKRRLTKHSDLISILSLPDNTAPGRSKSIRSARSVRTTRSHTDNATVHDLMKELAGDEAKYLKELKTLVDGVIPVLLKCVLSNSDSATAVGLFNPSDNPDSSFTKPIVDMGIALEKLKSFHKRIPLEDSHAFLHWAQQAYQTYEDYLKTWRMGFQDVVVNLAPAATAEDSSLLGGLPRNKDGDVVDSSGDRVDVAYLLKRPLVRVKYLCRLTKGLDRVRPTDLSAKVQETYRDLESLSRRRAKEEQARMVDNAANSTDPSRARDPRTLAQVEDVSIDTTRQVCAKDFFSFDMKHSNGQRIECRVEMLLRDKLSDKPDSGDVLVCAADDHGRWLLFPPIARNLISARIGDYMGQVVVMIRGIQGTDEWRETFIITTDDLEAATEWVEMLGTKPMPTLPSITNEAVSSTSTSNAVEKAGFGTLLSEDVEIPIGERRRRAAEETHATRSERRRFSRFTTSGVPEAIKEESFIGEPIRDLNEAMNKAGTLVPETPARHARARYHACTESPPPVSPRLQSAGRIEHTQSEDDKVRDAGGKIRKPNPLHVMSGALSFLDKVRSPSPQDVREPAKSSISLDESVKPEPDVIRKLQKPVPTRKDCAPPPPAHRTPVSSILGKTPPLESPAPKGKALRSSSPLKHEYQPSYASGTSSSSEASDSDDDGSLSDSSDDDELEAADLPEAAPGVSVYGKRVSPSGSIYSLPNTTLAPSNSASQAPYRGVPVAKSPENTKKNTATISSWSDKKGRWEDLHPGACSIVISPGLIEAFELGEKHSCPPSRDGPIESSGASDANGDDDAGAMRPLVALVLTPLVSLRQSTALDIEIQSPPTARSRLRCSGTVRYRAANPLACQDLYQAIHRARLDNPVYKKLEQERMFNSYGTRSYEAAIASNRRRSWFGRRKSYRASARAPSATVSDGSMKSRSTAFSAMKRLSGGGMFNIAKSSIDTGATRQGYNSGPASSYGSSDSSGITPPRTPTSPSLSGTTNSNAISHNLGSENLKIRLYCLETSSKWNDIGAARLTVTQPPPGMRQASALYHGLEKRIIVTRKPSDKQGGPPLVLLDVVLGSACFSKIGRTGIALNVWEDVVGDDGTVGTVGRAGGLSGRTRKWLFQCGCAADANWIFGLVACGR